MIFPETGPMVIKNRPTPVFLTGKDEEKLEAAVERILASVAC
jgi:hypothetical protein